MSMTPFEWLYPEAADWETRCVRILEPEGRLPPGTYRFVDCYCTARGCDCRDLLVMVLDQSGRHLATINHAINGTRERSGPRTYLDPGNRQSELAEELLRLFETVVCTAEYNAMLERHLETIKAAANRRGLRRAKPRRSC